MYIPDNEDLESIDDKIKFKNRSSNVNQLGYKIIRRNFDFVNQPIDFSNSIWEIRYDFTLNGITINIPENVTLKFNGGSFRNGILNGNHTRINAGIEKIFNDDIILNNGFIIEKVYPQWFGAKGNGINDDSSAMILAHKLGNVFYPNGNYLFTSKNLELKQGSIIRESEDGVNFTNGVYNGIISFDRSGALIGLHHNHLEEKHSNPISPKIISGNIVKPPFFTSKREYDIDVLAYWYSDFGLDAIRDGATGWNGWYTWEWAHTDQVSGNNESLILRGYQPKRHPLLGWYRGDDVNVLDWQCYWLAEAGVKACILQTRTQYGKLNEATWSNLDDENNWIYKLYNEVPNASNLSFVPWVLSTGNSSQPNFKTILEDSWKSNIELTDRYNKAYVVNYNGLNLITVFVFEGKNIEDWYGSSTKSFYIGMSNFAKSKGYDGICVLARYTDKPERQKGNVIAESEFLNNGILYLETDYQSSEIPGLNYSDYGGMVNDFTHNRNNKGKIVVIPTDRESSSHDSNLNISGSTPEKFKIFVKKAVQEIKKDKNTPNILSIYNVSEWAEAGAGLVPTIGNGWGYLDAIREGITSVKSIDPIYGF